MEEEAQEDIMDETIPMKSSGCFLPNRPNDTKLKTDAVTRCSDITKDKIGDEYFAFPVEDMVRLMMRSLLELGYRYDINKISTCSYYCININITAII